MEEQSTTTQVEPGDGRDMLKAFVDEGLMIPVGGAWFKVVKVEGPYVMLRFSGLTSKLKQQLDQAAKRRRK